MSELKEILNIIEELRSKLNKMAMDKAFNDPEVIAASQMFDAILNEYHRIMKKKVGHS